MVFALLASLCHSLLLMPQLLSQHACENGLTTCGYYPIKLVVLKLCYGLYNAHDSETVGLD